MITESNQVETPLETEEATRKPFNVTAVQLTLQNIEQAAKWCGGEVGEESYKMVGTWTKLPCLKVPGNGASKGQKVTALIGQYIVKHNGSFRIYRADQYKATFDVVKLSAPQIFSDDFGKGAWVRVANTDSAYYNRVGQIYALTDDGLIAVDFSSKLYEELEPTAPFYVTELVAFDNTQAQ